MWIVWDHSHSRGFVPVQLMSLFPADRQTDGRADLPCHCQSSTKTGARMVAHGLRQSSMTSSAGGRGSEGRTLETGAGAQSSVRACVRALRRAVLSRENLRLLPYGGTGLWIDFWDGWAHVVSNQEDLDPQEPSPLSKT